MPGLSVIVPCYNEEGSIGSFLRELAAQASVFRRFEIIVVDDASQDGSPAIIRSLAADLPLRVITHPRKLGLGAAVRTGFNAATLEWLTYLPGDGQAAAGVVRKFLPYMAAYDLIITRRAHPGSTDHRRLASTVYAACVSAAFGLRIRDVNGAQTWRRSLWLRQPSTSGRVVFLAEFLVRSRAAQPRMVEIEIDDLPRRDARASVLVALKAAWHITRLFVEEGRAGRWHCLHPMAPDRPEPLPLKRVA